MHTYILLLLFTDNCPEETSLSYSATGAATRLLYAPPEPALELVGEGLPPPRGLHRLDAVRLLPARRHPTPQGPAGRTQETRESTRSNLKSTP